MSGTKKTNNKNKQQTKPQKAVPAKQASDKKTRNNLRAPKKAPSGMPCWAASLLDPFDRPACHIPDDNTAESGRVKGWARQDKKIGCFSPATATTHSFGWIFFPNSEAGYVTLQETTSGSGILAAVRDSDTSVPTSRRFIIPNLGSFALNTCQSRVTAMGLRIEYAGTELNRSGKYYAGLLPISDFASGSVGGAADPLSVSDMPFSSTVTAGIRNSYDIDTIRKSLVHSSEGRIMDGTFHAVWKPAKIPQYALNKKTVNDFDTLADGVRGPSIFSNSPGQRGAHQGQYALVVIVSGDTVSVASNVSNTYSFQFTQHVEVMPDDASAVTYPVSPSTYDVSSLQQTVNILGLSRVATTLYGTTEISASSMEPTMVSTASLNDATLSTIDGLVGAVTGGIYGGISAVGNAAYDQAANYARRAGYAAPVMAANYVRQAAIGYGGWGN